MIRPRLTWGLGAMLPILLVQRQAFADDAPPKLESGDTAWMLASTALVLMMTVPGTCVVLRRHGPQEEHFSPP